MTMDLTADLTDLVEVEEFRAAAERVMPEAYRDFVNNVGMDETLRDDLAAWRGMHLRPRALVDVSAVDTSVTVLGQQLAAPVITAPFVAPVSFTRTARSRRREAPWPPGRSPP
jgi:4-hydroxymandelate oxidase